MARIANTRPEVLEGAPLQYAPENELGVVFLFSHIAKRLRIGVERVRPGFPDCIAYQKTAHGEKRIRIEFEFKSSHFKTHNHPRRKCDCIVCWEHDWPGVPEGIGVIELRKFFGLGFKVWIQPFSKEQLQLFDPTANKLNWGFSKRATKGDLALLYHGTPEKCIKDVFVLTGELKEGKASWRPGNCYWGTIKRVCKLASPIFFEDMHQHRVLKTSFFVRRNI